MTSEKLNQAVQLIKAGNKQAALPILKEIVQIEPNNETAWLWLYSSVDNTSQKKYCLQKVLEINPNNQNARNALSKLSNQTPAPQSVHPLSQQSDYQKERDNSQPSTPAQKKKSGTNRNLFIIGGCSILVVCLCFLVIIGSIFSNNTSPTLVATAVPSASSGNSGPEPTATNKDFTTTKEPTVTAKTVVPVAPQNYKIGDVVSIGDYVLVVLGWENVPANAFSKPDAGKKLVAVELLIVNKSQSAMSISTMLQMTMKDDTGQKYDVDFMASTAMKGDSVDGELSPGEKIRGKVGFQIPENAQGLQFVFDASVFGTGKVFVELGSTPVKVEPPAELAGETAQQTYNVGDVIAMGTTTLKVNEVSSPFGDQFNKPEAGNKFYIVDITIENKGTTAISVSTLMQMSLKDASGQKYSVDLMASVASGGSSPDGEIAPGEKLRGQVGFQVPKNATGLVFVFDADVWGTGKIFVTLP